jgi:hypothetical protein
MCADMWISREAGHRALVHSFASPRTADISKSLPPQSRSSCAANERRGAHRQLLCQLRTCRLPDAHACLRVTV